MSSSHKTIKIVVLGDLAVGKTGLLVSFTKDAFSEKYVPTEFDNYHTKLMVDGREIELDLVDTSGEDDDKLRSLSFDKADIFMVMFAMNQRDSFINCKGKWLKEITETNNVKHIPFILIGTKCDLKKNKSTLVSQNGIDSFVSEIDSCFEFIKTSVKTQEGVKECFECAVKHVLYPRNNNDGCTCIVL
eukprot:UN04160